MELETNKGVKFLIDDEDFELIKNVTWCSNSKGYITGWCTKAKKLILLHRIIMNVLDDSHKLIDHKNKITTDNRKNNLRLCNCSENAKNKKPSGKSKYLGVCIHISKSKYTTCKGIEKLYISKPKFLATIVIDGKQKHLGLFSNEITAANAYNEAAIKYHGEFASLNII